MNIVIASDIHGDAESAQKLCDEFECLHADKLLLLGDILYHGPRNDLPDGYAPKKVISVLNRFKDKILCVRGNCDAEVDAMVLEFPILAGYALIHADGLGIVASHGHVYNVQTPPPLGHGDILLNGHTHIPVVTEFGDMNVCINPGSVSIPKEGSPKSYIILNNGVFSFRELYSGREYMKYIPGEHLLKKRD